MFQTLMRAINSGRFSLEGAVLKFSSMSCAPVRGRKLVSTAQGFSERQSREQHAEDRDLCRFCYTRQSIAWGAVTR